MRHFSVDNFRHTRWYYNNIKGKTEQEASLLQYYTNPKKNGIHNKE